MPRNVELVFCLMLGAVSFGIFSRFAIFNHFTTNPVRITVFLNDFLRAQLIVDLCYSLISRFNRNINIRKMLSLADFISG